jgi:hypothetical protein
MMTKIHCIISWILILSFVFFSIGNENVKSNLPKSEIEVESLSHPCPSVLYSVSWNPNSSLALLGMTDETVYIYDGQDYKEVLAKNQMYTFYCSQWSPDGSFALLGSDSRIYNYNRTTFNYTHIGNRTIYRFYAYTGIDWKPDGSQALIIGLYDRYHMDPRGLVITYDGTNFHIAYKVNNLLSDVEWKPDGSYAIIVGEKIIKYDGTTFSTLYTPTTQFHGVAWKPDGSYALIVGGGSIWKYDGVSITELYSNISYEASSGVWMQVPLNDVEWNPDGSYALIAGGYGRVYKYDEESLIELKTDTRDFLNDIDWRPDGKYALIVGGSSILRYPSSSFNNTIEATFDIDPNTLNLKSKGRWITCYITLNDPYDVNDIDISTILLEDTIPAEWGDIQGDTLIVKFDRSEVEDMLPVGTYNLKVTGELTDGTSFEGYSDEIKVIDPGK